MRRWRAYRSLGFWAGVLVLVLLALGAGAAAMRLGQALSGAPGAWRLDEGTFVLIAALIGCLLLSGVLFYRLSSARSLSYVLDRNAVFITWLGNRHIIPMDHIESADLGVENARLPWLGLWPFGYRRGEGRLADGRPLLLFATAPLHRCLVIYTAEAAYALSPEKEHEFIQELEQHRELGVIQRMAEGIQRSSRLNYGFWLDRANLGPLLVVLGLNLLLWALLSIRYEYLPEQLLLRIDPTGGHLQPKHRLLLLPLGALGLSVFNLTLGLRVHQRERAAAALLQSASVVLHLLALIALLNLIQ